ncbi:protein retinal degeneration B-like isoform X1 [Tigriopus californicus]|uniref:protein retinal degeneration B-like isoform X1 n=1 Tax=Tigriopus californicus TaxID=6832 RepID=UPI0027DA0B02|nr:protein retinal degeneration B-like isoform X1 [Tigriopus californicus]
MLIKEYRIPLPMTVEEYRIAQLYMIAKKSREESKGTESGVEIMVNEPYTDGPGGSGQYTHKIYHVGSHLPGWFKSLLPKSALTVEEQAWNAYPYTKTKFTCPFVEKFSLEIETYYTPDGGHLENVFNLTDSEKRNRVVDLIDVVKDQDGTEFEDPVAEDPTVYVSEKTLRGPLSEDWIEEYWSECKGKVQPTETGKSIMCAYKLCKVEFRYWGMQSKIERFIHDVALRKTMLKAHLQAWTWQDEWFGLTMEDIRTIEKETAELLKRTMRGELEEGEEHLEEDANKSASNPNGSNNFSSESANNPGMAATFSSIEYSEKDVLNIIPKGTEMMPRRSICLSEEDQSKVSAALAPSNSLHATLAPTLSRSKSMNAPPTNASAMSVISAVSKPGRGVMSQPEGEGESESPGVDSDREDDEFFDCRENLDDTSSLAKWSSMELSPFYENQLDQSAATSRHLHQTTLSQLDPNGSQHHVTFRRVQSMRETTPSSSFDGKYANRPAIDVADFGSGGLLGSGEPCSTTVLILVAHGGSVLDLSLDTSVRKSDVTTFRGAFESIMRAHYPGLVGHVVIKCVPCPGICTEALAILSSLSPYSFDVNPVSDTSFGVSHDHLPVGTIPLFATASSPEYSGHLAKFVLECNRVYHDFLQSEEGAGFCGQVCLVGDSIGAILSYDALCGSSVKRASSDGSINEETAYVNHMELGSASASQPSGGSRLSAPPHTPSRKSSNPQQTESLGLEGMGPRLDFDVSDFFAFGSPLGILLAYRKIQQAAFDANTAYQHQHLLQQQQSRSSSRHSSLPPPSIPPPIPRPAVHQMYNLFHPSDPLACRVEPLLSARFSRVPPVNVPRYQKYPMGDGQSLSLIEFIQLNPGLFSNSETNSRPNTPGRHHHGSAGLSRRVSEESILSGIFDTQQIHTINVLKPKWWGSRRIDFALYCPEGLANFPTNSLPHLFHSSYWESVDVISFILRQLVRGDASLSSLQWGSQQTVASDLKIFTPNQPREKWNKKRTSVKIRNGAPNHRANDVIVKEGSPQTMTARFSYGPLDMAALTGEKVDVHIMKEPPAGDWIYVSTELTDKSGRVTLTLPRAHMMGYGIYPIRMLVRGDHTMMHMYLAVVPPKTETVVFSIDGSFAASVSVTGKDPKVKPGAVDIVRHWQELGYVIVYVTGRPDMQLQRVVSWLAQHNFPHGLVSFADGFTTDPLRHKAEFLKGLVHDQDIVIHCAYGSTKDIGVYSSLGMKADQIYIEGKASKKLHGQATFLTDGYADHLAKLTAHGGSRPAQGNARMVIHKTSFGLPGQNVGLVRRRTMRANAKRTTSYPLNNNAPPGQAQEETSRLFLKPVNFPGSRQRVSF